MFKKILASVLLFLFVSSISLFPLARPVSAAGEGVVWICNFLKAVPTVPPGFPALPTNLALFSNNVINYYSADRPWYDQSFCQFALKVYDTNNNEIFGERYTYAQINWILQSLSTMFLNAMFRMGTNIGMTAPNPDLAVSNPLLSSMSYAQQNTMSFVSLAQETLNKLNPIQSARAQTGFGYNALDGVRLLWSATRNMAYLLVAVLLAISAMMILFRVKINPQTAVSLQMMIPKLIITLIAITFSYAIAGLVIDLVYLLLGLFITLLPSEVFMSGNPVTTINYFFSPDFARLYSYYTLLVPVAGLSAAAIIPVIGGFIMPIVVWVLLFRVWWMMMKSYIMLIAQVLLGPFQILIGLLPGQSGFGTWFRHLVANASVFLVIPIMVIFNMILWSSDNALSAIVFSLAGAGGVASPGLGTIPGGATLPNLPLFGYVGPASDVLFGGNFFKLIMGFGILALMPKAADMIKDSLKAQSSKYMGTAVGEALGPVSMVGGMAGGNMQPGQVELERKKAAAFGPNATQNDIIAYRNAIKAQEWGDRLKKLSSNIPKWGSS